MSQSPINVLVLCTANSARSILGEALVNALGSPRFMGYSAGSHPRGEPNPFAIELLEKRGHDVSMLSSKSWDVFSEPGAPAMDIVITVCDSAAGEACPVFPGPAIKAHWGIDDPAGAGPDDDAIRAAFERAYGLLEARILALISLPVETMSRDELKTALSRIGAMDGATDKARNEGTV